MNSEILSGVTVVNPSGFLYPDAIFDNSLLGDIPIEHVSFVFSLTSFLICCAIWLALTKS